MKNKTPLGIKVFGFFYAIVGLILIILYAWIYIFSEHSKFHPIHIPLGIPGILFTIGNVGILKLKNWGRRIHLILVWPLTILVIIGSLTMVSLFYFCTDDCDKINKLSAQIAIGY